MTASLFFNELDILNLRLHVLSDCVDRFIIEESTRTFSGEPKELCFEKNKEMFAPFLSRIDYVVVSETCCVRTDFMSIPPQRSMRRRSLTSLLRTGVIIFRRII